MVGWHHRLYGYEFERAPGVGEGQGAWYAAVCGVTENLSNWTPPPSEPPLLPEKRRCSCDFVSFLKAPVRGHPRMTFQGTQGPEGRAETRKPALG